MTTTTQGPRRLGSKISFSGALDVVRPVWAQASRKFAQRSHSNKRWLQTLSAVGAVTLGSLMFLGDAILTLLVWTGIMIWYGLIAVFGLFVIPWKIHMRSQRRASNERQEMIAALRSKDGRQSS